MNDNSNSPSKVKKMGVWMCASLVVGNMVGSGIFLLPASLSSFGPISLGGWFITSAGAIILALIFAKLARVMPAAGGPYAYCREGMGEFAGFLIAWGYWIALWAGNAAIIVALLGYLGIFFPALDSNPVFAAGVGLATLWTITFFNCRGARTAGFIQIITTILKLVPLLGVALIGLFYIDTSNFTPVNISGQSNFSAVTATAALTLWAFLGLESATVPADNIENPEKTIPRATVLGTIFAAVLYILCTIAIMGMINPAILAKSTAPFADAARIIIGDSGYYIIGIGAIISCVGTLNGWTMMTGQVPMAAARDRLFPAVFSQENKAGAPVFGLVVSSVLISLLMMMNFTKGLVGMFTFIIQLAVLCTLLPYLLCAMGMLMMYLREPKRFGKESPTKLMVLAGAGFIYALWTIAGSGMESVYWGFMLLMAGIPVYVWMNWRYEAAPATAVNTKD